MRVATYAVLAVVATAVVARQLARWERYTEDELARRETQLQASLIRTQELLASVRQTAETLQQALLPSAVVAPRGRPGGRPAPQRRRGRRRLDRLVRHRPAAHRRRRPGRRHRGGHDSGAAPVVGLVRGAVRSYALEGHPPSVVLERAHAFLLSAGVGRRATVAYAEIYPDDRLADGGGGRRPAGAARAAAGGEGGGALQSRPGPALGIDVRRALGRAHGAAARRAPPCPVHRRRTPGGRPRRDPPAVRRGATADSAPSTSSPSAALAARSRTRGAAVVVVRPTAGHRASVQRTLPVHRRSAGVARVWISDLLAFWRRAGWSRAGRTPTTSPTSRSSCSPSS